MGFNLDGKEIVEVKYNQSFINSNLKLFGNIDFAIKLLGVLGCNVVKSSETKSIELKVKVGNNTKIKILSYDKAHKYASLFVSIFERKGGRFCGFLEINGYIIIKVKTGMYIILSDRSICVRHFIFYMSKNNLK